MRATLKPAPTRSSVEQGGNRTFLSEGVADGNGRCVGLWVVGAEWAEGRVGRR